MPNNIKNRLEIIGSEIQVKKVLEFFSTSVEKKLRRTHDKESIICQDEGGKFKGWYNDTDKTFIYLNDRDKKIPGLPKGFEYEYNDAFIHFPDFNKVIPQPENIFRGDLGRKEEEKCKLEGRPTWYSWNTENWGTKWNSYCCECESKNTFTFETAWGGVIEIIKEMSRQLPEIEFRYEYSDEDTGYNCGAGKFKDGLTDFVELEGGSKGAYDLAFKLRPHDREGYQLVDGKYEYIDED